MIISQTPEADRKESMLPPTLPYDKLRAPHATTRSADTTSCSCSVCQISGAFPRQERAVLISSIFGTEQHPAREPSPPSFRKQCLNCFTYVGKGIPHDCSRTTKRTNLECIVKASSYKTKGRVTTSCLKAVFAEAGVSTRGGTVPVPSGSSCPLKVTIGTEAAGNDGKAKEFSGEDMIKLQTAFNFSDKTTL